MAALSFRLKRWAAFLFLAPLFLTGSLRASVVERDYSFPAPRVKAVGGYHRVEMPGLRGVGKPGEPVLPVGVAKVLLPYGEEIESVEVIAGERVAIEGSYRVEPGQLPLPLSFQGPYAPIPPKEEIYSSPQAYPGSYYRIVTVQLLCGHRVAFIDLYPVEYLPAQGKLYWYRSFRLRVVTVPSAEAMVSSRRMLKRALGVLQRVRGLVDNPGEMSSYQGIKPLTPSHSSLIAPDEGYRYVIITNGELSSYFQPLADFHTGRGIKAGVFLVEDIYNGYEGRDNQEKVRNFIIEAYQNWGTEWVLLGGDDEIIPHRGLYSEAAGYYDDDIASDLYYAGLDGDWNQDGDNRWGEPGEDDLLAEVWVGRMAVDSGQEAQNFIGKVISYQESPVVGDCAKGLMAGEDLGWAVWGKDYKEEIREGSSNWGYTTVGFPEWFAVGTLYDKDSPWGKDDLIGLMNGGQHLINHLGHANVTYALKMNNSDVDNFLTNDGVNEGYFIIYTQGCYCNAFDNRTPDGWYTEDAIAEHFTGIANGAVAFMGNTRYGWGSYSTTDGPSQHYDRQFFDALFGEGLSRIGLAFQDSKEDNIGYIDGECMRWCYYQLCLLGDPAMDIWTDVPQGLYVEHPSVAIVGPAPFTVSVSLGGSALEGALVCLRKGEEVYESGETDATGQVTLYPSPLTPGLMEVAVTAHNGLPYQGQVTVIPPEGPYVTYYRQIVDDDTLGTSWGNGDGQANPGELIELPVWVKNWGNEAAYGVQGVLSTDDPYVTVTDSTEGFGDIASGDTVLSPDDYDFAISLDCPNGHLIGFTLRCRDSQDSVWASYAKVMVKAPVIAYDTFVVDDGGSSQPNGGVDPGETVDLIVTLRNTGYADAYGVGALLSTDDGYVSIINEEGGFGVVPAGGSAANVGSPYIISVSSECPRGHLISFGLEITGDWGYATVDSFNLRINPIFTDVTLEAHVGDTGVGRGTAWGDFNGDGNLDLYVANSASNGESNKLYRNEGDGTFVDVTGIARVGALAESNGVCWADYDNDGYLDIYVANWGGYKNVLYKNLGNGTFSDVTDAAGVGNKGTGESAAWGDYNNDGYLDLYVVNLRILNLKGKNILYRNNGDGTFTDVTDSAGVGDTLMGEGASWCDFDNDGDQDLYLTNRHGGNVLYRNNGDGTFTNIATSAGVCGPEGSHGLAWGDYDNDGKFDIYVANWGQPNTLYRNNGDGTFVDVSEIAGVDAEGSGHSVSFVDYDNDGWLDIYVVRPRETNILYRNNGDGTFTDVTNMAGVGDVMEGGGCGCAFGDYDNDGDLDLYISKSQQTNLLYRNNGNDNNWLFVKTRGTVSNRDGIGAKVKVVAGALSLVRQVSGGSGFLSENSLPLEFGLGMYPQADTLIVYWPSGIISTMYSVQANSIVEVVEEGGYIKGRVSNADNPSQGLPAMVQVVETGNKTIADSLGWYSLGVVGDTSYTIEAGLFGFKPDSAVIFVPTDSIVLADFALYPASVGTLQGTVWDSLSTEPIVGAAVSILNTPLPPETTNFEGFYRFPSVPSGISYDVQAIDSGYLTEVKSVLIREGQVNTLNFKLRLPPLFTDVAPSAGVASENPGCGVAFGDYDNDGDQDIYVASGQRHAPQANILYRNNGDGTFTDVTAIAGVDDSSYGAGIAFGDYDNDGDLDIYLSNYEDTNVLYRNNGDGTFTDVTSGAGVGGGDAGEGVAWVDYDNDGDLDLYVMTRYDGGVLYRNNGNGTFTDVTQEVGISNPGGQGWGVAWADYDNDGDLDLYVVRKAYYGENSCNLLYRNNGDGTFTDVTAQAGVGDSEEGLSCAFGDYDNDGDLDLYVTNQYKGSQADILYRNNGDGTFTDVTQEAGVVNTGDGREVAFGDFDNDGYLDIYVANTYQANILFHNNGNGTFTDIAHFAGIDCDKPGGAITLCDYDNDGDLDIYLAVGNGETNVLYQNNGNENHWLVIKTKGVVSNRDGIGARVRVVAGELSMIREVSGGSGYLSQNSLPVEFGLGRYSQADTLMVKWPSGIVDTFYTVGADNFYTAIEGNNLVGVNDNRQIVQPERFSLSQNYPNPFNPFTRINYSLPKDCNVKLSIYNILSQRVRKLVDGRKKAGYHYVIWDGKNEGGNMVGSGIYFFRIEADGFKSTKKAVLLR